MPASEVRRKTASVAAIGAVIVASVWLRPSPEPPAAPLLPARIGTRAGILVQSPRPGPRPGPLFRVDSEPVQSRFRVSSDPGQTGVRVGSDRGRIRVGPGSESAYEPTRDSGTLQELRTAPTRLALNAIGAPSVAAARFGPSAESHVSRAFATAGRHTAEGFRTAGRVLRSVF